MIEKNLAAAWRLQQDDLAAWISLRKKLGEAGCPLRKLDKALGKFDREMRSDYSWRAGTRAKAGEVLPGQLTLDDFMAFMPDHRYIHLPTGILWPAASVNARLAWVDVGAEKPIAASVWLAQNRHCEQMTWAPGYPSVIPDMAIHDGGFRPLPGNTIYNLYKPPVVEPGNPRQAWPWLELLHLLYPEEAEEIINFYAHRVQKPAEKINHVVMLGGAPGIGKDSLLEPIIYAVGEWNYAGISPIEFLGRFNGFLKSVLLVINEARDLGDVNSYGFYEHMKTVAAAPPHTLRIDMKNLQEFKIPNVTGVTITTNYLHTGLYLPINDRRHLVAWSDQPGTGEEGSWSSGDFDKFYDWLENQGGKQNVAAYLRQRDLSKFNPKAPPRKTSAFYRVANANRGEEEGALADAIDNLSEAEAAQGRASRRVAGLHSEADRNPHRRAPCGADKQHEGPALRYRAQGNHAPTAAEVPRRQDCPQRGDAPDVAGRGRRGSNCSPNIERSCRRPSTSFATPKGARNCVASIIAARDQPQHGPQPRTKAQAGQPRAGKP